MRWLAELDSQPVLHVVGSSAQDIDHNSYIALIKKSKTNKYSANQDIDQLAHNFYIALIKKSKKSKNIFLPKILIKTPNAHNILYHKDEQKQHKLPIFWFLCSRC